MPPDRTPFPLPESWAMHFTVQPGGASLTKGAQITYPNVAEGSPGKRWRFLELRAGRGHRLVSLRRGNRHSRRESTSGLKRTRSSTRSRCRAAVHLIRATLRRDRPPDSQFRGDPVSTSTGLFRPAKDRPHGPGPDSDCAEAHLSAERNSRRCVWCGDVFQLWDGATGASARPTTIGRKPTSSFRMAGAYIMF